MKRLIYASNKLPDEMKECAKFIQQFFKHTKTPFVVTFEDLHSSDTMDYQVKLLSTVKTRNNYYFTTIQYDTWMSDEKAADSYLDEVIDLAIKAASRRYPEFKLTSDLLKFDVPRGLQTFKGVKIEE